MGLTAAQGAVEAADLLPVKRTVVRLLLDGPRAGMPVWGWRGLGDRLPGRDKSLLLLAVDELCAEGVVELRPTVYQGRGGRRVLLVDPQSPYGEPRPRRRDRLGRYISEGSTASQPESVQTY